MSAPALLLLLLSSAAEWTKVDTVEGIEIFARDVPEERFPELRLVVTSSASVDSLCDAAWGSSKVEPGEPAVVSRKLLELTRNGGVTERVTYEQAEPPMASPRDFALKVRRESARGACRLTFAAANGLAPALKPGVVRIEKLRGSWQFETVGAWTRLTYTVFTDPAGAIPPLFVGGSLQRSAVERVQYVLRRALRAV